MRQVVLDTETTGLEPADGHRIIEIGCVEVVDRRLTGRNYHQYINPEREVEAQAIEVHGITNEFLADKPTFDKVVHEFLDFIKDSQLVIHNAPFDVGFIDHELAKVDKALANTEHYATVLDTLVLARKMHPGQRASLDALCKRYDIDNSQRDLHGALLDAEILADVYLAMTGGQTALAFDARDFDGGESSGEEAVRFDAVSERSPVVFASAEELEAHEKVLEQVKKASGGELVWPSSER